MSLFFEYETTSDYAAVDKIVTSCWSGGDSPLLSVAHRSGRIKFYNVEVQHLRTGHWTVREINVNIPAYCIVPLHY